MHRTEVGLTGEAMIRFLDDLDYLKRVGGSWGVIDIQTGREREREGEIKRKGPV